MKAQRTVLLGSARPFFNVRGHDKKFWLLIHIAFKTSHGRLFTNISICGTTELHRSSNRVAQTTCKLLLLHIR